MKITDTTRVFETRSTDEPRSPQRTEQTTALPEDTVKLSAEATNKADDPEVLKKMKELEKKIAEGRNIVDRARIADAILAEAAGIV